MFKAALAAILVLSVAGCANGWPRARHPPPSARATATASCIPTGSKIARGDCATTTPAHRATEADIDRALRPGGVVPGLGKSPGGN